MANEEQLAILMQGVDAWNKWRSENQGLEIDLSDANLSNANLSGAQMQRVNLSQTDLRGANLTYCDLRYTNLSGANLLGATLGKTLLEGANLTETYLAKIDFREVRLIYANLSKANLSGADLRGVNLSALSFAGANLSGADLREATLHEADFDMADLSKANLHGANLSGAPRPELRNSDFEVHEVDAAEMLRLQRSETNPKNWRIIPRPIMDKENYLIGPNLRNADLTEADLSETNLGGAELSETNLRGANLYKANLQSSHLKRATLRDVNLQEAILIGADLLGADLSGAKLSGSQLVGANLNEAILQGADLHTVSLVEASMIRTLVDQAVISGSSVYGVNVWDLIGEFAEQKDLLITANAQSVITVDNIKVAQFIYLILHNGEIRDVINTLTSKSVLILGRFAVPERKAILDALRNKLREYDLLPIVFDFDRPIDRDFTETIKTLAGISCFVIADVTNPKSSPLELQATVPDYQIPFVPIIQKGEQPFAMMVDLQKKYNWVLNTKTYDSIETLISALKPGIIDPAIEMHNKLRLIKAQEHDTDSLTDYLDKTL